MTQPCAASEWRCKMTKAEFEKRVDSAQNEPRDALSEVWSNLNNGQQKKLVKNEKVEALLNRYGVVE